jgi:hypothetical protein
LTIPQSYELQNEIARLREERGEKIIGYKVGCTSKSIQERGNQLALNGQIRVTCIPFRHAERPRLGKPGVGREEAPWAVYYKKGLPFFVRQESIR